MVLNCFTGGDIFFSNFIVHMYVICISLCLELDPCARTGSSYKSRHTRLSGVFVHLKAVFFEILSLLLTIIGEGGITFLLTRGGGGVVALALDSPFGLVFFPFSIFGFISSLITLVPVHLFGMVMDFQLNFYVSSCHLILDASSCHLVLDASTIKLVSLPIISSLFF